MSLITSGWLAKPAGKRLRLRRSTIVLLIAFFGLGALYVEIRTEEDDPRPVVVVTPTTCHVTETTMRPSPCPVDVGTFLGTDSGRASSTVAPEPARCARSGE